MFANRKRHAAPSACATLAACFCVVIAVAAATQAQSSGQSRPAPATQAQPAGQFRVQFDNAGITSIKFAGDKFDTDYIADEATLGHVRVRYGSTSGTAFIFRSAENRIDTRVRSVPGAWERTAIGARC